MINKTTTTAVTTMLVLASLTGKSQLSVPNTNYDFLNAYSSILNSSQSTIQFKTSQDLIKPNMYATKLKSAVNTEVPEMGPLVSPDGKTLFFSRYNQTNEKEGKIDEEDIWYANWDEANNKWGEAKNIGAPLNNEYPNYVNSITADGNTILLGNTYLKNGNMKEGLSLSHRTADGWSFPENIKIEGANKCSNWTGCYLSNSGNVLIIACEQRKNNIGGGDLYVSTKKIDNTWSKPVNLGSTINSKGLESAPFLSQDEKTIFFTSDGQGGFGGSDIFMATRLDESWTNWSTPENLGDKINTVGEESFFSLSPSDNKIYFAADGNSEGNLDIFTLELPESNMEVVIPVAFENNKEVKEQSSALSSVVLNPVYFGFNKAKTSTEELSELVQLQKLLKENPTAQIEVTGHTDNIGSSNYNNQLAHKRAANIAEFLAANGIEKERIIIKNMADKSPIANNQTKEGRSLNRRVDFKIVQQESTDTQVAKQ